MQPGSRPRVRRRREECAPADYASICLGLYLADRQERVLDDVVPTVQRSGLEHEYFGTVVVDLPTTRKD